MRSAFATPAPPLSGSFPGLHASMQSRTGKCLASAVEIGDEGSAYFMGDDGRAAGLQAATRFVKGFLWLAADNLQRNVKRYKVRPKCPGWCRLSCAVY